MWSFIHSLSTDRIDGGLRHLDRDRVVTAFPICLAPPAVTPDYEVRNTSGKNIEIHLDNFFPSHLLLLLNQTVKKSKGGQCGGGQGSSGAPPSVHRLALHLCHLLWSFMAQNLALHANIDPLLG